MKLAAPIRRHFRRPPMLQQQACFFAKEGESPAFFQPGSEPRMKEEASFFSAKGLEEEPQAKEPEEQEAPAAKAPEEEEPVKPKQTESEAQPIAAKCSCGCGGSGSRGKSAAPAEQPEQAKAPANGASADQSAGFRAGPADCSPAQESVAASAASEARSFADAREGPLRKLLRWETIRHRVQRATMNAGLERSTVAARDSFAIPLLQSRRALEAPSTSVAIPERASTRMSGPRVAGKNAWAGSSGAGRAAPGFIRAPG